MPTVNKVVVSVSYQLCVEPRRGRLDRPLSNPKGVAQQSPQSLGVPLGEGRDRADPPVSRRCLAGVNGGNAVLAGTVIGRAGHRTDVETSPRRRLPLRINARVCRCAVRCNAGTRTGEAVHPYRPPSPNREKGPKRAIFGVGQERKRTPTRHQRTRRGAASGSSGFLSGSCTAASRPMTEGS